MNPSAAIYISVPAIRQALATYALERMPWLSKLLATEFTIYLAPTGRLEKGVKQVDAPKKKDARALPSSGPSKPRGRQPGNSWHGLVNAALVGNRMTAKEVCDRLASDGVTPAYATVYSYLKRKASFDAEAKRFYMAQ